LEYWDEDTTSWYPIASGVTNWTSPLGTTNTFQWLNAPNLAQPTYVAVVSEAYPTVIRDQFPFPIMITGTGSEPLASVTATVATATEAGAQGTLRFSIASAQGANIDVNYVLSGTAQSGVNFVALSGIATIISGNLFVDIPVTA